MKIRSAFVMVLLVAASALATTSPTAGAEEPLFIEQLYDGAHVDLAQLETTSCCRPNARLDYIKFGSGEGWTIPSWSTWGSDTATAAGVYHNHQDPDITGTITLSNPRQCGRHVLYTVFEATYDQQSSEDYVPPHRLSIERPCERAGWQLGPSGVGPLRIGMTKTQVKAVVPDLEVEPGPYCESWSVPGVDGVQLVAPKPSRRLTHIALPDTPGRGAAGVEHGTKLATVKARFRGRLRYIKRIPQLRYAFYRVYAPGRHSTLQFTINTRTKRVVFEEVGRPGSFYYPDGNELCA